MELNCASNNLISKMTRRVHTSSKAYTVWMYSRSGLRIRIGLLPKFNGDFLLQGRICDKILMKFRSLTPEIYAKLWENAMCRSAKESKKKFPEADDFQNVISSFLSADTL